MVRLEILNGFTPMLELLNETMNTTLYYLMDWLEYLTDSLQGWNYLTKL